MSRSRDGASFILSIIVGRGSHSAEGKAILKPAIEQLLTQRGVAWSEREYGGELSVVI